MSLNRRRPQNRKPPTFLGKKYFWGVGLNFWVPKAGLRVPENWLISNPLESGDATFGVGRGGLRTESKAKLATVGRSKGNPSEHRVKVRAEQALWNTPDLST
jgi:hypothetical protein